MMSTPNKPARKRRKKAGKYTPLIWVVTGALIAFFISYSASQNSLASFFNVTKSSSSRSAGTNTLNLSDLLLAKQNTISQTIDSGNVKFKLYFAEQSSNYIILAAKNAEISNTKSLLKDVLEGLIQYQPAPDEKFQNLIPMNTKILSIKIKDYIAYIDFNDAFSYNSYGIAGYEIQINQIVYTACQFDNIKAVYFYLNGKPLKYLGGDGYILNNPIYPQSRLPQFSL